MQTRSRGFTLIELVIAITLTFIVVGMMALFVTAPIEAFFAQTRRAELNDSVDGVWRSLARDVRNALPNSVRRINVAGVEALEMLEVVDSARYRPQRVATVPNDELYFNVGDQLFATAGRFQNAAPGFDRTDWYLAIDNRGIAGGDAYAFNNVMTPPGTRIRVNASAIAGADQVQFDAPVVFAPGPGSPTRRMHLVAGPVTYLCNPAARTVVRYNGYIIAAGQAARASHGALVGAGAVVTPIAADITACTFSVSATPVLATDPIPVVTIRLTASQQNESVNLMYQAHSEQLQ